MGFVAPGPEVSGALLEVKRNLENIFYYLEGATAKDWAYGHMDDALGPPPGAHFFQGPPL